MGAGASGRRAAIVFRRPSRCPWSPRERDIVLGDRPFGSRPRPRGSGRQGARIRPHDGGARRTNPGSRDDADSPAVRRSGWSVRNEPDEFRGVRLQGAMLPLVAGRAAPGDHAGVEPQRRADRCCRQGFTLAQDGKLEEFLGTVSICRALNIDEVDEHKATTVRSDRRMSLQTSSQVIPFHHGLVARTKRLFVSRHVGFGSVQKACIYIQKLLTSRALRVV